MPMRSTTILVSDPNDGIRSHVTVFDLRYSIVRESVPRAFLMAATFVVRGNRRAKSMSFVVRAKPVKNDGETSNQEITDPLPGPSARQRGHEVPGAQARGCIARFWLIIHSSAALEGRESVETAWDQIVPPEAD